MIFGGVLERAFVRNIAPMDIHWEAPPAEALFRHENKGGKYIEFALALKAQPGEWALMPGQAATTRASASGLAQSIRLGSTKGFKPKGSYDALYHYDEESETAKVYVRYLGLPNNVTAVEQPATVTPRQAGTALPVASPADPVPEANPPAPVASSGNGSDDDPPGDPLDDARPSNQATRGSIREWARENGWPQTANHGRLPDGVLDAYDQAHAHMDAIGVKGIPE